MIETKFGRAKISSDGYYRITTRKEGNHNKFLHRLIYEDAHGPILDGFDIHHIDGDRLNNDLCNLEAVDMREHRRNHNLNKSPEEHNSWKDYPRIVKDGTNKNGKQNYVLVHKGTKLKYSVDVSKLIDHAGELGLSEVKVVK